MSSDFLWQAEDIVRTVRGTCLHEQSWDAKGVSIDSRLTAKGDLFIALQGAHHDGHDYVTAAFAAGASAAIVARQPQNVSPTAPLIFVEDTAIALNELGREARNRSRAKIIAVTGSVGKTSTKEMLRLCLSAVGKTYASPLSYNNHVGLPLALANLPPDANFGVFEMGMNHAGELRGLSLLARPDIALITTVDAVHVENFSSLDSIADAKAEVFEGLGEKGVVILNRDDSWYAKLSAAAKKRGCKNIVCFSETMKGDASLRECASSGQGSAIKAVVDGHKVSFSLASPGRHLVRNALAALLGAYAACGHAEECAAALSHFRPLKGRGAAHSIAFCGGHLHVVDETCNTSPVSVRAVIKALAEAVPESEGRRILVLGDMPELGATSPDLHLDLVSDIRGAGVDLVFCCGDLMRYLFDALPPALRGAFAPDSEELAFFLARAVRTGDVVTVKGPRSMDMDRIIEALNALADPEQIVVNA
jgi:UDP-N-acetylmuramoyl-tripeptide--D-alanyl-D-alanine ligase